MDSYISFIMDAGYWINKLNLQVHPEGGYYKEVYRSNEFVISEFLPKRFSGNRSFSTAIYFLLNKNQISAFHKLKSDEIWHYYTGSQILIHILSDTGKYTNVKLGLNLDEKELPQIVIPRNHWFAAELIDKSKFTLLGCTVAPGFDFNDFVLGKRDELVELFPKQKNLILKMTN